jgi:hypothetical protein
MQEYLADDDELVVRITQSFIDYRDTVGGYMTYADNGQMNARAGVFGLLMRHAVRGPGRAPLSRTGGLMHAWTGGGNRPDEPCAVAGRWFVGSR